MGRCADVLRSGTSDLVEEHEAVEKQDGWAESDRGHPLYREREGWTFAGRNCEGCKDSRKRT